MLKDYRYRIIVSGGETEIYTYEEEQRKRLGDKETFDFDDESSDPKEESKPDQLTAESEGEYRRRSNNNDKVKQRLRRLVNANINQWKEKDKFLTLTFAEKEDYSEYTRDEVSYCFKKFKMRFEYQLKKKFEYIAVIERGSEGTERLHLHIILFNMPYIKQSDLLEIWQYGGVFVERVKTAKEVAKYMTKYVDKTLDSDYIPKGKKFYFTSRGLLKPQESYLTEDEMEAYLDQHDLGECVTSCEFTSEYINGSCVYMRYNNETSLES